MWIKYSLITISLFCFIFGVNVKNVIASNCTQTGNTSYCDDGTSYTTTGNTTYGSDGTSYTTTGNTTYGSDGSNCTKTGNTTYCSDGTSYTTTGNTTYGSDGSSFMRSGNTTYGNSGTNVVNNCPSNSTYNSSSGKCECQGGYRVEGSTCVYDYSYDTQQSQSSGYTNPPTYDTQQKDSPGYVNNTLNLITQQQNLPLNSNPDTSTNDWATVIGVGTTFLVVRHYYRKN